MESCWDGELLFSEPGESHRLDMELDFWSIASTSDSHTGEGEDDSASPRFYANKRQKLDRDSPGEPSGSGRTELSDIPSSIVASILSIISDVRTRNSVSLVCREWFQMERATRHRLSLRGDVNELHNLPSTFQGVQVLDVSNISPWGGTVFQSPHSAVCSELVSQWLRRAFPNVVDLTVYVRDVIDLHMVAYSWPDLESLHLVRWHQRPLQPEEAAEPGTELKVLLSSCPRLVHLDLSGFYCWTEDIAPALEQTACGSNLRSLNLLKQSPEGFKVAELTAIASSCRNLEELYSVCEFDPRFPDCVNDECLAHCAVQCTKLKVLHLVDSSQFGNLRSQELDVELDASITARGLESVFRFLPHLQDLALLLGQNVRGSAPAFESMTKSCKEIRSVRLSHFHGVCNAPQMDGLSRCAGIRELFLKNCSDLTDLGLSYIALGCPRLQKLGLRSCSMITESGISDFTSILRRRLIHFEIESCQLIATTAQVLRALTPVISTLRHLHVDCIWSEELEHIPTWPMETSWKSLENLSLWIAAAQVLSPVISYGFQSCPVLRSVSIRVEGDCRLFAKPQAREFGLRAFSKFESLRNLRLDLSEAIGYALSAPGGNRDLSIWERFYLQGIQTLAELRELDYYPPSDKDVNYRGMTLPGVGLISQCVGLRKLFVHGTAYEHLFMMLLKIPSLRDCQLRADYFPTPEMETGTEMRTESCRRFEKLLELRGYPD